MGENIMIIVKGHRYFTIVDAARKLGVSAKTIRCYIEKGIISEPPTIEYGVRIVNHFPPEFINKAKEQLDNYRNSRSTKE